MTEPRPYRTRSDGYLLTNEAAAILQVSPKTVSRWAAEGRLAGMFVRTLGSHRRFSEEAIRDLAERLKVEPTGDS